jgi:hypothetical protein
MKMLILAAIRCSLMFTVVAAVSFVHLAQAHLVTLEQVGSDVVATGIGAINLTGLTSVGGGNAGSCVIRASGGEIDVGAVPALFDLYIGFTGPASFGSGAPFIPNSSSGNFVGISGNQGLLFVPQGYQSGAALSGSATWNNATFASLGVTPGTYVWT